MKQRNIYIAMAISLTILLIAAGFSLAMMLMEIVEKVKWYGTLSLVGLAIACVSFIIFVVVIVLDRKCREKRKN